MKEEPQGAVFLFGVGLAAERFDVLVTLKSTLKRRF